MEYEKVVSNQKELEQVKMCQKIKLIQFKIFSCKL